MRIFSVLLFRKCSACEEAQPYMEQIDGKDFIVPVEKYGVKLLSIGFFVDPASATVWRGPMASNALKQMVEQGFLGRIGLYADRPSAGNQRYSFDFGTQLSP